MRRLVSILVLSILLVGSSLTARSQNATAPATPQPAQDNSSSNWNQRALVGFVMSAASSTDPQQKLIVDFNAQAPLCLFVRHCSSKTDFFDSPILVWFNPKLTSVPKPSSLPTSAVISQFGNFNLGDTKLADLVQGIDFQGGGELKIVSPRNGIDIPGIIADTSIRSGLALIFGGGAVTPLSSSNASIFSQRNATINTHFPNIPATNTSVSPAVAYDVIAFVPAERSRFYRSYFAGFRFKFYYFSTSTGASKGECFEQHCLLPVFPGLFDIKVGQNELVSGGLFRGPVIDLDATFPIPIHSIPLYVFGSLALRAGANKNAAPLLLSAPSSAKGFSDSDVFIQPVSALDRDIYNLGIAVDLLHIAPLAKWAKDHAAAH